MRAKDGVGQYGERVAARHLEQNGLQVIECNWRCGQGEIDIVAREGELLVFVEVKTRSSERYGVPAEAVNWAKRNRIRGLATMWLAQHPHPYGKLRFDVVSVLRRTAGASVVDHYRDAF